MKAILCLLVLFSFVSCSHISTLPTHSPINSKFNALITTHSSESSLIMSLGGFSPPGLLGYSYTEGELCYVHYIAGDYETLAHELAHCMYGKFH